MANDCERFWGPGHDWSPWELVTVDLKLVLFPGRPATQVIRQQRRCKVCGLYEGRRVGD